MRSRPWATAPLVALILFTMACGPSEDAAGDTPATAPPVSDTSTATVTAPSGGGEDSGNGALPDPCSLLTRADVEAFAGFELNDGVTDEARTSAVEATCEWESVESTEQFGVVQLVVSNLGYETMRDAASTLFDVSDVSVAGAERAYADASGSPVGAEAAGLTFQVTYSGSDQDTIGANASDLVEIAIANLAG